MGERLISEISRTCISVSLRLLNRSGGVPESQRLVKAAVAPGRRGEEPRFPAGPDPERDALRASVPVLAALF